MLATVVIALLEGTRFNEFAYWQRIETRLADLLPGRPAIAKTPAAATAEKHVEPAQ
jgi:hypothetical protein